MCRAEGVYGQNCRLHRSSGLSTQLTDPVKMLEPPDTNAKRIGKAEVKPRKLEGGQRPLSPKDAELFKKNYPSTELNPEKASSVVRADSELCNLESDDEEKENLKPRESEGGPRLRRNAIGVWVDTGFRGPGR